MVSLELTGMVSPELTGTTTRANRAMTEDYQQQERRSRIRYGVPGTPKTLASTTWVCSSDVMLILELIYIAVSQGFFTIATS